MADRWSTDDMIDELVALDVQSVSLETCYLESGNAAWTRLKKRLDSERIERVVAWGHPRGLEMGSSAAKFDEMMAMIDRTADLGSALLRIVLGGPADFGTEPSDVIVDRVVPLLNKAGERAADRGIEIAIETHCDVETADLLRIIETVGSGRIGVVLDTANVVRIGADLIEATRQLAPHVRMVHLKDIDLAASDWGNPGGWWPCTALGEGDLDLIGTLDVLDAAGFDGLACVEIASVPPGGDERDIVRRSLAWLNDRLSA